MTLPALRCPRCGRTTGAEDPRAYTGCPSCAVGYECELAQAAPVAGGGPGLWRWGTTLPVDVRHAASLGEGNTPLVALPRVARDVGVQELYQQGGTAT